MKAPLSILILLASPFLLNALYPIKYRNCDLHYLLMFIVAGGILFPFLCLLINPILKPLFNNTNTLSKLETGLNYIYKGALIGLSIGMSTLLQSSSFESESYSYYIRIYTLISSGVYLSCLFLESLSLFRSKFSIIYDISPSKLDLFVSPLSLLFLSEYIALSSIFYILITNQFISLVKYCFIYHPYLSFSLLLFLILSIILTIIFFKFCRSKIKA